ncbi:hypothetical protein [Labedaea rhizosphaerae]|uniref:Uncharacterized protein n=1 Tax=Labedaea rhizosphaerae TaxID=598644 RepID=A0A4R6RS02_LABRH|nr:hypothetical protein [Labedaea rhizosphaerae]TDP89613.1 hypothetical protein EV186_11213 [Labedaea rhizosphaerae]
MMGLFGPRTLPVTSYGYQPPPGATAKGWVCPNCGVAGWEPVKRWPKACDDCGSSADPLFDQPWEHQAEGFQIQWILRYDPTSSGGFYEDRWESWQFTDAAYRGDRLAMSQARGRARARAQWRLTVDSSWWPPSDIFFRFVSVGMEVNDFDGAADDLCYWLGISSPVDVDNNNANRTNCRLVIGSTSQFLALPHGASHPRAFEIRRACVALARGGAYSVLNADLQRSVSGMAQY